MSTADPVTEAMWSELEAMPHPKPPERPTTALQAFTRTLLGLTANRPANGPQNGPTADSCPPTGETIPPSPAGETIPPPPPSAPHPQPGQAPDQAQPQPGQAPDQAQPQPGQALPCPAPGQALPDIAADKLLDPIAFNRDAEAVFVKLLADLVAEGPQPTAYVLGYIAFELNVSPATVKRYLLKYATHPAAPFAMKGGTVRRREP